MHYVVGLGNPGDKYKGTRHNVGRRVVEEFQEVRRGTFSGWSRGKNINALFSEGELSGEKVTLVLPETFMNKSGDAVASLIQTPEEAKRLVVVHDDLDIPLGAFKVVFNRGAGGHKGVESVTRALGTQAFARLRVGIAQKTKEGIPKRPPEGATHEYVLALFSPKEEAVLTNSIPSMIDALTVMATKGVEEAMNRFN